MQKNLTRQIWFPELFVISHEESDGQQREVNKRKSHEICRRIGLTLDSDASWKITRSSSTRENLRKSLWITSLDLWSKTTLHQKWQSNHLQYNELRVIRCLWSVNEFFYFIFCFFNIFIVGYCDQNGKSSNKKKWHYQWGVVENSIERIIRSRNSQKKWRRRSITKWIITDRVGMTAEIQKMMNKNYKSDQ